MRLEEGRRFEFRGGCKATKQTKIRAVVLGDNFFVIIEIEQKKTIIIKVCKNVIFIKLFKSTSITPETNSSQDNTLEEGPGGGMDGPSQ